MRIPIILVLNLLSAIRFALASVLGAVMSFFRQKKRRYVHLPIKGGLPFGHPSGFGRFIKADATFLDLRRDIKTLAKDNDVDGVLLEPGKAAIGMARNADLVDELDKLRAGGKHVVAQAATYQTRDYVEATAADAILLPPAGRFYSFGPRFEQFFLADAFEKHGISAQFVHIGAYKAAASRYVRNELSDSERKMMEELREGIVKRITARVATRRRLTTAQAEHLFSSPMDSRRAIAAGFLDGEAFAADLQRWLEAPDEHSHLVDELGPSDIEVLSFDEYTASKPKPLKWRPLVRPKQIAIVDLQGIIVHPGVALPGGAAVIDPETVIPLLKRLGENRRVAAVILHINSPGGSALGSDMIWNAVSNLRALKPVVAYCSDVAASGGYYIAVAADRIVCRPETITGSIGVVAGKFAVRDALQKFGVSVHSVDGNDGSEFASIFAPLEERTLANLKDDARSFYRRFLQRVGQARGIDRRRLHRYARGRVYLGDQAHKRELVDDLGGFEAAVRRAKQLCADEGVQLGDDAALTHYSHQTRGLKDVLKRSAFQATGVSTVLGPLAIATMLRHEPLLALMPWRVTT